MKGHEEGDETRAPFLDEKAERTGTIEPREGKVREDLRVYEYLSRSAKRTQPQSFQWCPVVPTAEKKQLTQTGTQDSTQKSYLVSYLQNDSLYGHTKTSVSLFEFPVVRSRAH